MDIYLWESLQLSMKLNFSNGVYHLATNALFKQKFQDELGKI